MRLPLVPRLADALVASPYLPDIYPTGYNWFERKTPFGDEETGVEVCRKSRQMLHFFADSPIPATNMAQLATRTIETQWGIVVS
jgi:hypothetical protein